MHLSGWRNVMSKTYGFETHFLLAREGKEVVGVMPMFIVRSLLIGDRATTMPGGLCADDSQAAQALIERAIEVGKQANAKQFVIHDTRQIWPGDLHTSTSHVGWVAHTNSDVETLWQGLHRETRRQVRLARDNGLTVSIDRARKRVEDFYQVMSRFTHQAGTPVFGLRFLESVVDTYSDAFSIAVVYKERRPIGAYFQLLMGKTVFGIWGGSLHEYLRLRPVYLAFWELLSDASAKGYHRWDMGRSPADSNSSRFKGQWGGISSPIYQQVAGVAGHQPEANMIDRLESESRYQRFTRVWPKLPFLIVQFLGPKLRRHVPFA
jgi:FemAB-related protein (PEP-CTERM system-associated)